MAIPAQWQDCLSTKEFFPCHWGTPSDSKLRKIGSHLAITLWQEFVHKSKWLFLYLFHSLCPGFCWSFVLISVGLPPTQKKKQQVTGWGARAGPMLSWESLSWVTWQKKKKGRERKMSFGDKLLPFHQVVLTGQIYLSWAKASCPFGSSGKWWQAPGLTFPLPWMAFPTTGFDLRSEQRSETRHTKSFLVLTWSLSASVRVLVQQGYMTDTLQPASWLLC